MHGRICHGLHLEYFMASAAVIQYYLFLAWGCGHTDMDAKTQPVGWEWGIVSEGRIMGTWRLTSWQESGRMWMAWQESGKNLDKTRWPRRWRPQCQSERRQQAQLWRIWSWWGWDSGTGTVTTGRAKVGRPRQQERSLRVRNAMRALCHGAAQRLWPGRRDKSGRSLGRHGGSERSTDNVIALGGCRSESIAAGVRSTTQWPWYIARVEQQRQSIVETMTWRQIIGPVAQR